MSKKAVIVTGSLGFIGSQVVRECLDRGWYVMGVDKHTYAASELTYREFKNNPNYTHVREDITRMKYLPECDYVINVAAETHVDNSITASKVFLESNITGVYNLLELLRAKKVNRPTLIHFSTDEVYGDIEEGDHRETDLLKPSNPYAASKASADQLIIAWARTYGISYNIVRPTNNYGPRQYPEKLIPKTIRCLRMGKKIPLHNEGTPYRMWLHSADTAKGVMAIIDADAKNEIFNICGDTELQNRRVVELIIEAMGLPGKLEDYCDFTYSREGQDVRYAVDDFKLRNLGWCCTKAFGEEILNITQTDEGFVW